MLVFAALFLGAVAAASIPVLVIELVTNPSRFAAVRERIGRRLGRRPPPTGDRPLERISVELRRLSAVLTSAQPVSAVRRHGVERAYDETLVEACRTLGVEQYLQIPSVDHLFERLRVEAVLQEAGLTIRGPAEPAIRAHDQAAPRRWWRLAS